MMKNQCLCTEPPCNQEKRKSQWQDLMKAFCEKYKEKCKGEEPTATPSKYMKKIFSTGSSYKGAHQDMQMCGYGEYTFPNGVLYRGEFESGMFHGDGELVYTYGPEDCTIISGKWVKGIMTEGEVLFGGKLQYNKEDWQYCKSPDGRYALEINNELQPAGKSNITALQPPREIPPGFCDTGYGFFNTMTGTIHKYHNMSEVLKAASNREQQWIADTCRREPLGNIGPRQDFYENWSEPIVEPPPPYKLRVGFKTEPDIYLDEENFDEADIPVFYDPSRSDFERPPRPLQLASK